MVFGTSVFKPFAGPSGSYAIWMLSDNLHKTGNGLRLVERRDTLVEAKVVNMSTIGAGTHKSFRRYVALAATMLYLVCTTLMRPRARENWCVSGSIHGRLTLGVAG